MNVMFASFVSGWEWVIVLLAVLLLFGAKKIPELARGLGTGIKEFKKATKEVTEEIQNATDDKPAKTASPNQSGPNGQTPPGQTVSQTPAPPKA